MIEATTPNWIDHLQAWSTLAAAAVALVGLTGIFFTLRRGRKQQRIGFGPYIRVDVGPTSGRTEDFRAPYPQYVSDQQVDDLAPDLNDQEKVTLAAWLTNYQPHPLGTAFRVLAFFALEIRVPESLLPQYRYAIVTVAYVEHGKPVKIELFRVPREWRAVLWLARLAFSDFYDQFHKNSEGRNENALHGRLTCEYRDGLFACVPEGRPAGRWPLRRVL